MKKQLTPEEIAILDRLCENHESVEYGYDELCNEIAKFAGTDEFDLDKMWHVRRKDYVEYMNVREV